MTQKVIIGTLALLIVGVMGYGIYSTALPTDAYEADNDEVVVEQQPVQNGRGNQVQSEATSEFQPQQHGQGTPAQSEVTREPMAMASDNVGDVWAGTGTITQLNDFGFTLGLDDGSSVYVELGPPSYWQSQDVFLAEGDHIQVDGWNNGDQIHARILSTDNDELVLRSESSQPLWAGGANNTQGQNGNSNQAGQSSFQVAPDEWVTISGTVTTITNGSVSMLADDNTIYSLQMGQPSFWQSQGVSLNVGDEIEVLGFWMSEQFMVGDITKVATGEHIMLRDPNGRQLWAGPGRNGGGNNGNGGNGNGNGGGGNGNGNGGNGNGNGYHGGQ